MSPITKGKAKKRAAGLRLIRGGAQHPTGDRARLFLACRNGAAVPEPEKPKSKGWITSGSVENFKKVCSLYREAGRVVDGHEAELAAMIRNGAERDEGLPHLAVRGDEVLIDGVAWEELGHEYDDDFRPFWMRSGR